MDTPRGVEWGLLQIAFDEKATGGDLKNGGKRAQLFAIEFQKHKFVVSRIGLDHTTSEDVDLVIPDVGAVQKLPAMPAEFKEPHALDENGIE